MNTEFKNFLLALLRFERLQNTICFLKLGLLVALKKNGNQFHFLSSFFPSFSFSSHLLVSVCPLNVSLSLSVVSPIKKHNDYRELRLYLIYTIAIIDLNIHSILDENVKNKAYVLV